MTQTALKFAVDELRARSRSPMFWGAIVAVALVLGLSGPFHTFATMTLLPRLGYWLLVCVINFFSGWFVSTWTVRALADRGWPFWAEVVAAGSAVGLVVSIEVVALNWLAFGDKVADPAYLASVMANTTAIALVVTAAIHWAMDHYRTAAANAELDDKPRLLQRLDLDKRGPLVSLSVQDHYVEVVTTAGRSLLLMRLSDAIAETEGCAGLRVHRSHWAALDQVRAARREGARAVLTLSDGREIPVSRSFLQDAREAGLLS